MTDEYHPTQVLADLLTMMEYSDRPLHDIAFCYLGDGRGNMGHSLLVGAAKMGMDFRMAAPAACQPDQTLVTRCHEIAAHTGARPESSRKSLHVSLNLRGARLEGGELTRDGRSGPDPPSADFRFAPSRHR